MEVLQTEKENLLQQEPGSGKPLSLLNNSEVPIEREVSVFIYFLPQKGHVALDRASWSMNSITICNKLHMV